MSIEIIGIIAIGFGSIVSREFYIHIQLTRINNDIKWIKQILDQHFNSKE